MSDFKTAVDEVRKDLYSISETAEALGTSRWSIYRLFKSGELKYVEWGVTGRKYRYVPRRELERYINEVTKTGKRRRRKAS